MRTAGYALMIGGAVAASPLDEAGVAVATGGVGALATLVQAPATLAGGLTSMALGYVLLRASAEPVRGRRRG